MCVRMCGVGVWATAPSIRFFDLQPLHLSYRVRCVPQQDFRANRDCARIRTSEQWRVAAYRATSPFSAAPRGSHDFPTPPSVPPPPPPSRTRPPPPRTSATDKRLRGVIPLKGLQVFPEGDPRVQRNFVGRARPFVFSLHSPTKVFHIQAADEQERAAWIADVLHNVSLLNRTLTNASSLGAGGGGSRTSSFATAEVSACVPCVVR
jgi:hypothetical protein